VLCLQDGSISKDYQLMVTPISAMLMGVARVTLFLPRIWQI